MNYPVWEFYYAGGGLLIAVISILHVYVAHFAVGGGLFLVLTEMKAVREDSKPIFDYLKKHSKFFLLLTMVFGGVSGVGIWFTISLISPGPTSTLIHVFVFGWATEWVCFVGEIVALFIFYYRFDSMDRQAHVRIGWFYFIFAWLSLFFINGIVCFMLTPGEWLETGNFWDGFFNPTTWPSLFFRTDLSFMFAGIFGFITAVFIKDPDTRDQMVRYCIKWVIYPFLVMPFFAWWYLISLPDFSQSMVLKDSPVTAAMIKTFLIAAPLILGGTLFMAVRVNDRFKKGLAFFLLFAGLVYMGGFEWIREAGRKPFLIPGHTYSTGIKLAQENQINRDGILKTAKWVRHRSAEKENILEAGRDIFNIQCLSCHSVGGPLNDILPLTRKYTLFGMDSQLNGQGKINPYMPKFMGTRAERAALAQYIVEELNRRIEDKAVISEKTHEFEMPEFNPEKDEYILLAWPGSGMGFNSGNPDRIILRPGGSRIYAQLIRRGETPEMVTEDVGLTFITKSGKQTLQGEMSFDDEKMAYSAQSIRVNPIAASGGFQPYPLCTIVAKKKGSDKILARTKLIIPVSSEMGCRNCHGGPWKTEKTAGISHDTVMDILQSHDKISKTSLVKTFRETGDPVNCRSCHQNAPSKDPKKPDHLNLSASMHGFHANYLTDRGAESCHTCHPTSPAGATRSFRGIHNTLEMNCSNCHGPLEDHALSLLAGEKESGKKGTAKLMKHLLPRSADNIEEIKGRKPFINEPDCLSCHVDFQAPDTDEAPPNSWSKGKDQVYGNTADDAGVMCAACHGPAHALYPADSPMGKNRDTIQPHQYQGNPYPMGANKNCQVCHTVPMSEEIHHPNMLTMFRNTE